MLDPTRLLALVAGLAMLGAVVAVDRARLVDIAFATGAFLTLSGVFGGVISHAQLGVSLPDAWSEARRREKAIAEHCERERGELLNRTALLICDKAAAAELVEHAVVRAAAEWQAPPSNRLTAFLFCHIIDEARFRSRIMAGPAADTGVTAVWAGFDLYERALLLSIDRIRMAPADVARMLDKPVSVVLQDLARCQALVNVSGSEHGA